MLLVPDSVNVPIRGRSDLFKEIFYLLLIEDSDFCCKRTYIFSREDDIGPAGLRGIDVGRQLVASGQGMLRKVLRR